MQTTLTRILIVLESVSHGLSENSDEISRKARKFEGFFRPKSGGLQKKKESDFSAEIRNSKVFSAQKQVVSKKKKKVFTEIESDFSAELRNSKVFSAQKQVVSKKKKRSSPKLSLIFRPNSEIPRFFPPKHRWSPKIKKKVFAEIESDFSAKFGNSNVSGGAVFLWGGYFQFFTKNRPQKH